MNFSCLEPPFEVFGASKRVVWRLHSPRLEAPFTPFGGSIHTVWRLQTSRTLPRQSCPRKSTPHTIAPFIYIKRGMYRGGSSSFRQIGDHHGAQVPGPFAPFSAPVSPLLWSRHAPLGEPPLVIPPFIRGYRGGDCSPCRRHDFHDAEVAALIVSSEEHPSYYSPFYLHKKGHV